MHRRHINEETYRSLNLFKFCWVQHFNYILLGEKVDFFQKKCRKKSTLSPKKIFKKCCTQQKWKSFCMFLHLYNNIYICLPCVCKIIRFDRAVFALCVPYWAPWNPRWLPLTWQCDGKKKIVCIFIIFYAKHNKNKMALISMIDDC